MKRTVALLLIGMTAGIAGYADAAANDPELSRIVFYVG